jgi:acyl-CoA thioester hydrolase
MNHHRGPTPVAVPESFSVIHFQDCDPFGHLNNARYVDTFMNAREEHISRHYGIQILDPNRQESWVVNKALIAYVAPASMGEKVLIRTRIIDYSGQTLRVECVMSNEAGRRLKAVLWFDFTYVSLATGRPVQHPAGFMQLFDAIGLDVEFSDNFDKRVDHLRSHHRIAAEAVPA